MNPPLSRTRQQQQEKGKAQMGIPDPGSPVGVVLADEARRSRHRLYPVTVIYSTAALLVLSFAVRSNAPVTLLMTALGFVVWTAMEYWVHRYVLHGVFPVRSSLWSRVLNKAFDHLHWQHHLRPWDGNHINGTLFDTLWVVAPAWSLSFLAPVHTAPAFFAGFFLGYVIEEWCHHSVHFYVFNWSWFRGLKARHFYHHSRHGAEILFGLSNGFWDDVIGTGMPATASGPTLDLARKVAPARTLDRGGSTVPSLRAMRRSLQIRFTAISRPSEGRRPCRGPSSEGGGSPESRA
jgi:cyclopropane-fatty-acyl-phospholipid synthase